MIPAEGGRVYCKSCDSLFEQVGKHQQRPKPQAESSAKPIASPEPQVKERSDFVMWLLFILLGTSLFWVPWLLFLIFGR